MLKIDGLPYSQLQWAFAGNRLPFLQRLANESHVLGPFYSGIPSATPAVQGELFYGVKSSVPAVSFYDRGKKRKVTVLYPGPAAEMSRDLTRRGKPLLEQGRSYSNIYTGGAEEARYCSETMRLRSPRHLASSVKLFTTLCLQPMKLLKIIGYGILETGLALYDFLRGVGDGENVIKEFKFVPTRMFVCILLRELIRLRVKMDLAKGVRIVHASFLGYDEQAHRRGPDSRFAHWTLKGIDGVIEDIHQAALRSKMRDYRMIVYSDHGQESVIPFQKQTGRSIETAVSDIVGKMAGQFEFMDTVSGRRTAAGPQGRADVGRVEVAAMGPLGHIYFSRPLSVRQKEALALALVGEGRIPLVLFLSEASVVAVNRQGQFDLVRQAAQVLGPAHPFTEWTIEDLSETCRHPHAGDLVISGWSPDDRPVTFAVENGAHGGPGKEETRGFALIPRRLDATWGPLRPMDLRDRVLDLFDE
jgi:hypothetical protein